MEPLVFSRGTFPRIKTPLQWRESCHIKSVSLLHFIPYIALSGRITSLVLGEFVQRHLPMPLDVDDPSCDRSLPLTLILLLDKVRRRSREPGGRDHLSPGRSLRPLEPHGDHPLHPAHVDEVEG